MGRREWSPWTAKNYAGSDVLADNATYCVTLFQMITEDKLDKTFKVFTEHAIYIYTCVYTPMMCIYIHKYLYVYMCVYTYMCIYIHEYL